jgi:hypothetical protein
LRSQQKTGTSTKKNQEARTPPRKKKGKAGTPSQEELRDTPPEKPSNTYPNSKTGKGKKKKKKKNTGHLYGNCTQRTSVTIK